jgi:acid phosphatase family membrane protein YuiD
MVCCQALFIKTRVVKKSSDSFLCYVTSFYEDDEFSIIYPGMKYIISVQNSGGVREHKIGLQLCNLNELYEKFKKSHPDVNTGFYKFCELHLIWCVLEGAPGTHSVCVCCIHQNVKMMINSAKPTHTYEALLSRMVCNMGSEMCMLYGPSLP